MNEKIKIIFPFLILITLLGLLSRELFYSTSTELPSALIGEDIPKFHLPSLIVPNQFLDSVNLKGHVSLLNIWATWCYACSVEHNMLMQISEKYHVPIYSINYKDNPDDAKSWLQKSGNPYVETGIDKNGDAGIDLGIYGTPETFVISPNGKIVYRHVGVIDQKSWNEILYPLIKKYQKTAE